MPHAHKKTQAAGNGFIIWSRALTLKHDHKALVEEYCHGLQKFAA